MTDERAELVARLRTLAQRMRNEGGQVRERASDITQAADYIESQVVAGEAVYQWRTDREVWFDCNKDTYKKMSKLRRYQTRVLYTAPQPAPVDAIQRLRDAVEGECDGLAITDAQARAIYRYTQGHDDPAPADQKLENWRELFQKYGHGPRDDCKALAAQQQESGK